MDDSVKSYLTRLMNLDKEQWEKVSEAFDNLIKVVQDLWIDPDYTGDQENQKFMIKVLENTKEFLGRYFRK